MRYSAVSLATSPRPGKTRATHMRPLRPTHQLIGHLRCANADGFLRVGKWCTDPFLPSTCRQGSAHMSLGWPAMKVLLQVNQIAALTSPTEATRPVATRGARIHKLQRATQLSSTFKRKPGGCATQRSCALLAGALQFSTLWKRKLGQSLRNSSVLFCIRKHPTCECTVT